MRHMPATNGVLKPMTNVEFTVYGKPATAGSKRGIPYQKKAENGGGLGVRMIHDNKRFKSFSAEIKDAAIDAAGGQFFTDAVFMRVCIHRVRPKNHFGSKGRLSTRATDYPTTKPDALKVVRAIEDSLTGVLWRDDSQVVAHDLAKVWGECEKVVVQIGPMLT